MWRRDGDELIYEVRGNGFLHHMVRNLVGTFLLVGKGTLKPEDVVRILQARNRSAAGATAPASGLYLVAVEYDQRLVGDVVGLALLDFGHRLIDQPHCVFAVSTL